MAILGFADLKDSKLHALWDLTEMKKVQLAGGATFDEMLSEVQAALNVLNGSLLTDPHYGNLIAVQDTPEVEYPIGNSGGVVEMTDHTRPDPLTGEVTGHNIPSKYWGRALGWTMLGLRKRRRSQLEADVRGAVTDIRGHFQQRALRRFFLSTAEKVGATAGASVPFTDGGVADATYIPPENMDGKSFQTSHDHFLRYDTIANALGPAVLHLKEHGKEPPFDVIASEADAATWAALSGWKAPNWDGIIYRATQDRAALGDQQMYAGFVETPYGIVRVWQTSRVPTNYFGVYKPYGPGDARNPLRMRIDPNLGYGWQLVPGNYVNAPNLMAVIAAEYDFGIGEDRTNGVAVYINANGDYTDPNIS